MINIIQDKDRENQRNVYREIDRQTGRERKGDKKKNKESEGKMRNEKVQYKSDYRNQDPINEIERPSFELQSKAGRNIF